jgi:hypothetical protein
MEWNWCTFLFIIEILLLFYLLKLIYKPCVLKRIENFVLRKEPYETEIDPKLKSLSDKISRLFADDVVYTGVLANINKKKMLNEILLSVGKKSYTINKSHVYLCLRDENNVYYDDNMLIYVGLHEAIHVVCPEIGHTKLFHQMFDAMLEKATELGVYDPSLPLVRDYCNYNS